MKSERQTKRGMNELRKLPTVLNIQKYQKMNRTKIQQNNISQRNIFHCSKKAKNTIQEEEQEAPWQKTIKIIQPGDYKPYKGETNPPCAYIDIDYVHGYRCHDTRNNLKYSANGELIYHTAAIGIMLDTSNNANTQTYFLEHNDDIICLDAFDNFVVTGYNCFSYILFEKLICN